MLHFIICLNRHSFKFHQRRQIEFYLPVATAMSSFIDAILKATVGLLVNKGRNVAAEKLKDGDVTNEQLRDLIVSELDDIKSKLDGIARKDLLASIGSFKEGLVYLYKVKPNERAATPLKQEVGSSEASVKTVSLVEEMRSLQLTDRNNSSARALNDAKKIFKQARVKATDAFYNEGLSTSDRILAMQYRILATILEKVDRVPDALAACRFCLEELHSMPAVKKSFDIHLQQGFKSRFKKAEREDTIRSVCRMNRVIFHIAEIVEEDNDISLWPCIDRGEDKVDPLRDVRVTQTIEKEDPQYFLLKTWSFFQEGEETAMNFRDWLISINSKGQLVISATDGNAECVLLKLFDRNGNLLQSLQLKLPVTENNASYRRRVIGIASDRANNMFLLTRMLTQDRSFRVTVIVFDQHANFRHEFDVDGYLIGSCIAVSDDSKVFVSAKVGERGCVRVYNFNGVPLNSIENSLLESVKEMRSIDSESGRIVVLGCGLDYFGYTHIYQFSDQGKCLSGYYVPSNDTDRIRLLHKTEHVVQLNFSKENLFLYNKDGMVVREIKLSAFNDLYYLHEPEFTVTTQGLVAMLTTDKRTGERMIAIL
ncbi:PREDICTED: uncharacterized protein LOC107348872 isoform X4 [Acropora digitifera]|uniref:uncharacterized protein LOC107348872 isoform X3 n=1 Tax=Acropora digitifera TaxID=70779 RepID=UPI00077AFE2F|nr:PREDICTED: uncharacterized protein LOC107348872 isoform X3 [Acropora digitifera]XP_015770450.1 PREDICTED: uncharacterized protein LOC107348872 isoform X4 [Acropora digitifera]